MELTSTVETYDGKRLSRFDEQVYILEDRCLSPGICEGKVPSLNLHSPLLSRCGYPRFIFDRPVARLPLINPSLNFEESRHTENALDHRLELTLEAHQLIVNASDGRLNDMEGT